MSGGSAECNAGVSGTQAVTPSAATAASDAAELLGQVPVCTQGEAQMSIDAGSVLGISLPSANASASFSSGCNQITAMCNDYSSTKSVIQCVITSRTITSTASADVNQTINIVNYGLITATNFTVRNDSSVAIKLATQLSDTDISTVKSSLLNTVNSVMDAMQDTTKAQTSNVPGQTSISVAKTAIKSLFNDTTVNNLINSQIVKAYANQTITLDNYGVIKLTGDLVLQNSQVMNIVITSIVGSVLQKVLALSDVSTYTSQQSSSQTGESTTISSENTKYYVIAACVIAGLILLAGVVKFVSAQSKDTRHRSIRHSSKHDKKSNDSDSDDEND